MKDQRMPWNCVCVFLISVSLVSVVRCQTERKMIRKLVGKTAIFNCPYESVYRDSPKYLKKREHNVSVTLVRSDGQKAWTTDGRCNLNDKKNSSTFSVNIFNVALNDSGTYMCGVAAGEDRDQQETKLEVYNETGQTTVRYDSITSLSNRTTTTTTTSTTTATSPFIIKVLASVLAAAAVLVLIGIVIVCIRMRRKTRRSTERSPAPLSLTSNERAISQDNIYAQDTPSTRPLSGSDLIQPSSISNPPASHSSPALYPPVANQRPAQINTDSHIPVYSLLTLPDEAP
ncbi:uncharacterized protein LOC143099164 isoform X2 [Alosa pseudoharengus]|uniref:uncharacterized protein LOC143099164 isoform X2 n=1 Tax=Alosa pseudoharengus TaxID=34774 RepID=UPI003F8ABA0E